MREQDCTYCYTIYEINMYFGNTKVVLHYYTKKIVKMPYKKRYYYNAEDLE